MPKNNFIHKKWLGITIKIRLIYGLKPTKKKKGPYLQLVGKKQPEMEASHGSGCEKQSFFSIFFCLF